MREILLPILFVYQRVSQLRNTLYELGVFKPQKVNVPVLSVGNLAFGGTGKTPVAVSLAEIFLEKGYKIAVLSRGYKGKWERKGGIVSDGKRILCSWQEAGDEAFLIAKSLTRAGVFVGKNRITQSLRAIQLGFNLIILDDGFQYRHLDRNLDLVIISPDNLLWLREPLSSLKRAHIVLFPNEIDQEIVTKIRKFNPQLYVSKYIFREVGFFSIKEDSFYSTDDFRKKEALVFCGIAQSLRFKKYIEELDINVKYFISYPDHYSYPKASVENLLKRHAELKTDVMITTEKDALKLKTYSNLPIYYLKIKAELPDELISYILEKISFNQENVFI